MPENAIPSAVAPAWEALLSADRSERGASLYPDIFTSGILFPLQRQAELVAMMDRARSIQPKTVAEIGSDKGGGFYHWVKSLPTVQKAIAVEIRGVPFIDAFTEHFSDVQFCGIADSSRTAGTMAKVRAFLNGDRIDCLFLDGEKAKVGDDFEAWLPLMRRPGGLVFIHDIVDEIEPRRVFHQLGRQFPAETIIKTEEGALMQLAVKAGYKPANAWEGWLNHWGETSCGVGVICL